MFAIAVQPHHARRWRRLGQRFATLLIALALSATASAQEWTYRVRPGDNLWELSARHLRADVDWRRLQRLNQVADPHRLPPGTLLRFPVSWLRIEPAKARLVALRGAVRAQVSSRASVLAASEGLRLGIGGWLETGPGASATLEFADGSRLMLTDNSRIVFDRLSAYGQTGMVDTRMRLQRGRATNRVIPARGPASRYIIETPSATSSVRGTRFRVSAGDAQAPGATEVLEGKVQVGGAQGADVLVRPGYGSVAAAGAATSAPTRLLPAPTLDDAHSQLLSLPIGLSWSAQPEAVAYRVEVVRDDAPDVLLYETVTADTRVRIADLPPGRHRLQLRAVADSGLGGEDAERIFEVSEHPLPPLTLQPRDGQTVHTPRPRFEWARTQDAAGTRFELADDPGFERPRVQAQIDGQRYRVADALPPGRYYWRVASRDGDGRSGPYGDALPFEVSDAPVDPGLQAPQTAQGQLTLRWKDAAPGQRFRVQLARRADFAKPLIDREVEQPQLSLDRPRGGRWYVRVQTIDDDGYAAPFGPTQEIRLPCRLCYAGGAAAALLLLAL
ncbi:FecR domain-containing protein [Lysobacter sp. 5GHs7-4]|uniref:FecR domain-containing protein n=1 Tax=Lysobacter sp. 5GHs7-4 TaxID=2904253 RepID=UPI001E569882|nr:FecR domain-containing protein [Lysobacter sp. 5GHs7-4]UHQ22052.1 FecR domain-containing protein [Lysobacter sp. 5GHs7-4]